MNGCNRSSLWAGSTNMIGMCNGWFQNLKGNISLCWKNTLQEEITIIFGWCSILKRKNTFMKNIITWYADFVGVKVKELISFITRRISQEYRFNSMWGKFGLLAYKCWPINTNNQMPWDECKKEVCDVTIQREFSEKAERGVLWMR